MNIVNLSLLCVSTPVTIILSIVMLAIGGGAGIGVFAVVMNKKSKLANQKADKILADAHAEAEKIKKEQEKANQEYLNLLKSAADKERELYNKRVEAAKASAEMGAVCSDPACFVFGAGCGTMPFSALWRNL